MNLVSLKQFLVVVSLVTAASSSVFAMEKEEELPVSRTATSDSRLYNAISSLKTNSKAFIGALDVYAEEKGVPPTALFSEFECVNNLRRECSISKSFARALSKMDDQRIRKNQTINLISDFRDSLNRIDKGLKGHLLEDAKKNLDITYKSVVDAPDDFLNQMSLYLPEEVEQFKKAHDQLRLSPKEKSVEEVRERSLKMICEAAKTFGIKIPTNHELTSSDICRDHPVLLFLDKMRNDANEIDSLLNEIKKQQWELFSIELMKMGLVPPFSTHVSYDETPKKVQN